MDVKTNKSLSSWKKRNDGRIRRGLQDPDIRPLEHLPQQPPSRQVPTGPGHPAKPGNLASGPEIRRPQYRDHQDDAWPARTSGPRTRTSGVSGRPGHPARRPDVRPPLSTHSVRARGPCTPSPPRLYILLLPLSRVSKGLAQFRDRALLIHLVTSPSEFTTSTEKIPQADSRPLTGRPQDLLTEKNLLLVSSFVDRGSCISLCFEDLAHV
jgi:hypothetical protein